MKNYFLERVTVNKNDLSRLIKLVEIELDYGESSPWGPDPTSFGGKTEEVREIIENIKEAMK